MSDTYRLRELGVKHLEHVFQPAGLPLVDKGDHNGGTTSVLVKGSAGSGKTTLALSLAQSIARHHQGAVLYLTTEFSPAEIAFKAQILGLPPDMVRSWTRPGNVVPGTVLVEALSVLESPEHLEGSSARKLAAVDALFGLLHPEGTAPGPAVRAVVLDALTIPDEPAQEATLRTRLLEMIQGLEHEGISTVVVEEAAPGASEWVAFVVDVVFELGFAPDPETHSLERHLVCRKSRYSLFVPGPHVRGQEGTSLAVWPSSLRVVAGEEGYRVTPVRVAVAHWRKDCWVMLTDGGTVLSWIGRSLGVVGAVIGTPGARVMNVRCGSASLLDGGGKSREVPDSDGPYGLGWACLQFALDAGCNVCVFSRLEALLQRESWRFRLVHVLEALKRCGLIVLVHGPQRQIEGALASSATLIWEDAAAPERRKPLGILSAERWLTGPAILERLAEVRQAEAMVYLVDWSKCDSRNRLQQIESGLAPKLKTLRETDPVRRWIEASMGSRPHRKVDEFSASEARLALLGGDDWLAGRYAVLGLERDSPDPLVSVLWACMCASIAGNPQAIEELERSVQGEPVVLGPLVRSLARAGRLHEADQTIDSAAARFGAPGWLAERLHAEARVEHDEPGSRQEVCARLERLLADPALPVVHRAEVAHNLGIVQSALGNRDEAARRFREALSWNANLSAAKRKLDRLLEPEEDPVPP